MDHSRPLFALSSFFPSPLYTIKIVDFSGIQTRIIGVDGEHADHLTTTTGLQISSFLTDFHHLFQFLQNFIGTIKIVDYSGIQTRIIGVNG